MVGEEILLDERPEVGIGLIAGGLRPEDVVDFDKAIFGVLTLRVVEAIDDSVEHIGLVVCPLEWDDTVVFLADGFHREVVDEIFDQLVYVSGDFGD